MADKRKGSGGRRGKTPPGAPRRLKERVKTAKGRKASSTRWLQRQLNDPYVEAAKRAGYRSRAAFKLTGLDDKCGFLKKGARVLDLGAAPGGWTQVAVERAGAGNVFAVDILPMDPVPGAEILQLDFLDPDAPERIRALTGGPVDVVLSDMAAPATGHKQTDHLRIMALCEAAYDLARDILKPGGAFCAKVLQGGTERHLLEELRRAFATVRHVKPEASRAESAEVYVVATGFRGSAV
ncbi:MAG: RlmE family RNA methyltransferase [Alphaproteobacteria bacterium]